MGNTEEVVGALNVLNGLGIYSTELQEFVEVIKTDELLSEYFADEIYKGSDLSDSITGSSGDDYIQGYAGDDNLFGGAGNDVL